jgi:hypothetical protein
MSKRSKQRLSPYQYAPYGSDNLVYSKDFQSVMTSSYTQLNKDVFRRTVNHGKQQRLHLRERSTKLEPPYNIQASLKERDQRQVYTHWWKQRGRPSSTRPESMVAEDAARVGFMFDFAFSWKFFFQSFGIHCMYSYDLFVCRRKIDCSFSWSGDADQDRTQL